MNIILNRAQCFECNDVIISRHRHDFVTCSCGNVSVDGGLDYLKRSYKDSAKYKDRSVTTNSSFYVIREHLMRGGRGKDGTEEVKYVALKDMSNAWIENCIAYNDNYLGKGNHYITELYRLELEYRKYKGIFIED